ncbi:MAG: hypothetical protein J6D54_03960 [Olsenella sp.]|nr:hypothetical protein [Olsenella sp.]
MRRTFANIITVILAIALVFTLLPTSALADNQEQLQAETISLQVQSVDPAKANDAAGKFTDALSKFSQDTSKMGAVSSFLTRFGGLTSAASGAIGILQIIGIVKDPTQEALAKILDSVNNMKLQLDQIDKKIDVIHQELINVAVSQQEINRNNKATTMLHYWDEFNTHYCEPLNDKMNEYQGLINAGIKKWWETSSHDGIWVLYANVDNTPSLTYAKTPYAQGKPTEADNGESVLADVSFGVPSSCLPNTASIPFDVNSYRETFVSQMSTKFVEAANSHQLAATDAFYQSWNALSPEKKTEKARAYAADILNTQIYKTSCQVMSDNDSWVISMLNAYRNYCSNIMKQDSGVNAMLNAMYNSHGFEGEAKDDINKLIDGLTVQAGYYGQFALTCACQDSMQTIANRQTAQQQFVDTVTSLSNKKKSALKGHDNYCYVTGTILSYEDVEVTSKLSVHTNKNRSSYLGYTSTDWKLTNPVPNMLNDVYAQVLYRQYRANTQGCETFMDYLDKYGTGVTSDSEVIMTRWGGASSFSLDEGITMGAEQEIRFSDYFEHNKKYRINVGNASKIENKYFHLHDKITNDAFNLTNGTLSVNQVAGARAFYGEGHWYWSTDEPWVFWTNDSIDFSLDTRGEYSDRWDDYSFVIKIPILKSTAVHNFNGENDDDPFFAFGAPSLTKGVSDVMLPLTSEDERTPLTDLVLQSNSYTYTGGAVEPSAIVLAGETEVPADGYDITYMDNDKTGVATITATGKGAYSGKVSKTYEITESPTGTRSTGKQAGTAAARMPSTDDPLATPFVLSAMFAALAMASSAIALKRRE